MMEWTQDINGSCRFRAVLRAFDPARLGYNPGERVGFAYLDVEVQTIIHATDMHKRGWVTIARAVSLVEDAATSSGVSAVHTDLVRAGGLNPASVAWDGLKGFLQTCWADTTRKA
jgi:hypothetical protein